jgi:hypothetical protein
VRLGAFKFLFRHALLRLVWRGRLARVFSAVPTGL